MNTKDKIKNLVIILWFTFLLFLFWWLAVTGHTWADDASLDDREANHIMCKGWYGKPNPPLNLCESEFEYK